MSHPKSAVEAAFTARAYNAMLATLPPLVVRCAWCDPRKDERNVSHTVCPSCATRLKAELGSVGKGGGK